MDKILEEEIKKDIMMRNWESNSSDPSLKAQAEFRIREEVERRLKDVGEIMEFNRYMIEEHDRDKKRKLDQQKLDQ